MRQTDLVACGISRKGRGPNESCLRSVLRENSRWSCTDFQQVKLAKFPSAVERPLVLPNRVLVGDALHTAHYSIGSGTRLALEDVIALIKALEQHPNDLERGLQSYEAERKPIVQKIVTAATTSANWYAAFEEHMKLPPIEFGYSYITRSGRVDNDRLRRSAPNFMARYDAHKENRNPEQRHARAS
jgi:2-polyprenyl-6-methoxyphenol hydroxylase-like FAD-dependent oxidoreductase